MSGQRIQGALFRVCRWLARNGLAAHPTDYFISQHVGWVGKPNYSTAARVVSSHETDLLIDNMSNYSPQQTESREQDPTYRWTDLFGLTVLNAHLQERPSEVPLPPYFEHPDTDSTDHFTAISVISTVSWLLQRTGHGRSRAVQRTLRRGFRMGGRLVA